MIRALRAQVRARADPDLAHPRAPTTTIQMIRARARAPTTRIAQAPPMIRARARAPRAQVRAHRTA